MTENKYLEMAALLWCLPQHSKKEMDVQFGKSIAELLESVARERDAEIDKIKKISRQWEELAPRGAQSLVKDMAFLQQQLSEKEVRIRELEAMIYLPNHWQCPKCNFYQVNSILAPNGIFADKKTPENCPNDGTEMLPVSWKQNAQDGREGNDRLMANITDLSQKLEKAVKYFKRYSKHQYSCGRRDDGMPSGVGTCTCGFVQALKQIGESDERD